jgi:formylglycine-generating enzyme required for sulfatase activity
MVDIAAFVSRLGPGRYQGGHPLAVNPRDGSVLVHIPEGEFEMGSAAGEGHDDERPRHRVKLKGYWIGVHAVTNAQYASFVKATVRTGPGQWEQAGEADHPAVNVSWDDAQAYAEWAGCALASEAQWERACRGPKGLGYPWGEDWDQSRCRNDRNKGSQTTCAVYDYPKGASGYGTLNQSGNVWEWVADWYDEKYYEKSPTEDPAGPGQGAARVYRGGGWDGADPGYFRAAYRDWSDPGYRSGVPLGFRLVRAAS